MNRTLLFQDGCGFEIQAVLGDPSCRLHKFEGWWGGLGVDEDPVERLGDGEFPGTFRHEARRIVLGFTQFFATEAELLAQERAVSGLYDSLVPGRGIVHVTYEGSESLTAFGVQLAGPTRTVKYMGARMLVWEVTLKSPDPYLYGPLQQSQVPTPGQGVGLQYPLYQQDGTLFYGAAATASPSPLVNYGNARAYPVVRVQGDMPSGFRLDFQGDVPDGTGVEWRGSLSGTQVLTVDMYTGRAVLGDVDQSFLITRRLWGGVARGGQASASLISLGQGGGVAQLQMRPTYK